MRKRARDNLLDWSIEIGDGEICLKRIEWASLVFLMLNLFGWAGFFSLFAIFAPWQILVSNFDWRLFLIFSVFGGVPLFLVLLLCSVIWPRLVSSVQFKTGKRSTVLTYAGIFKRTIPALPSILQIGEGGARAVWANLLYSNSRVKIPLFVTARGAVDTTEQAKAFGLKHTAEIRDLLELEIQFRG